MARAVPDKRIRLNDKRVPASRFLFFHTRKGGYHDFAPDKLDPADDPQFIVDLPPAPVGEELKWSIGHTENSLRDYAMFMPTTVRRDGAQQSVGQVQNIVNFQMLIATPTSLLLDDISHLALDAPAAAVMRRFNQTLVDLQREMAAEPSRYWQLFPSQLEAGVSC